MHSPRRDVLYRRWNRLRTNYEMFGLSHTVRLALLHGARVLLAPSETDFDRTHGTTTNDWVEVEEGGLPQTAAADAIRYVPTRPELIRHICKTLPIRHQEYTFVDLGSGRGRALLLASHFPFKQIIGIEVSPQHHQIAKANLAIYDASGRQCDAIEAICMDAGEYEFPQSNLVIYMYQPFVGKVFKRVLDHIAELGDRFAVFVCCSAPWRANREVLSENRSLHHLKSYLTLSAEQDWLLYSNAKGRHEFETP
jgi:SAM-dependent methyltransferase